MHSSQYGEYRRQSTLLADCLDVYIYAGNPVRLVEAFVDELDLIALGLSSGAGGDGRHLERGSQRNVELIWLTGLLMPDFKTLIHFRRDNDAAIQAACVQFVVLCRRPKLFSRAVVAVDGSKFKAINNRDKNFTAAEVEARLARRREHRPLVPLPLAAMKRASGIGPRDLTIGSGLDPPAHRVENIHPVAHARDLLAKPPSCEIGSP